MSFAPAKRAGEESLYWPYLLAFDKALGQPGCVVCNHLSRCERKAINGFLYEAIMDSGVRQAFLERGGFCQRHFALAIDIEREYWPRGGVAMALLCKDLLGLALERLAGPWKVIRTTRLENRWESAVSPNGERWTERCVFCAEQRSSESSFVVALEDLLDHKSVLEDLTPGRLCFAHTQAAIECWCDQAKRTRLIELARSYARGLARDLAECVRRYDHRFLEEVPGREGDAVPNSMRFLVGGAAHE